MGGRPPQPVAGGMDVDRRIDRILVPHGANPFVAVSINLDRIIAIRGLPGAALGAIVLLVAVLLVSTFGLVPGQPRRLLAGEVLVVGIAAWSIMTAILVEVVR